MKQYLLHIWGMLVLVGLLLGHPVASAESNWKVIKESAGWGTICLDTYSIFHDTNLSTKEEGPVFSACVKTELSPFGAGVFTGYMLALQKKNPQLFPGVDFSKVQFIEYIHKLNIKTYTIATESVIYYDTQNKLVLQQPNLNLKWSSIKVGSDDELLIKTVIEIQDDKFMNK